MRNILTLSLAASTLFLAATKAQAATFIDNFNNGEVSLEISNRNTTTTSATDSQTGINGVLGGSRDITFTLDRISSDAGRSFASIDLFGRGNRYIHDNGFGIDSTVRVLYNGFGQTNLSAMGDRFTLDVIAFEPGSFSSVGVSVMDASGNQDFVFTNTLDPDPVFSFSDFVGIDFSAVTAITLQTEGLEGRDITLDNFRVELEQTPEPAAIFGLLACLGFGTISKKKQV